VIIQYHLVIIIYYNELFMKFLGVYDLDFITLI